MVIVFAFIIVAFVQGVLANRETFKDLSLHGLDILSPAAAAQHTPGLLVMPHKQASLFLGFSGKDHWLGGPGLLLDTEKTKCCFRNINN